MSEEKATPCSSCGSLCDYATSNEPCWGEVDVVDEVGGDEGGWIHSCEGHKDIGIYGKYKPYVPAPTPLQPEGSHE